MKIYAVSDNRKYIPDIIGFIDRIEGGVETRLITTENVEDGFDEVYVVKEIYGDLLTKVIDDDPDIVVGVNTRRVLEAVSYYAGWKGIPIVTEVNGYSDGFLMRNILSGRGFSRYTFTKPIALTVSPGKFRGGNEVKPKNITALDVSPSWNVVGRREKERTGVDIEAAEIVVGVGRGFKDREDLKLAFELADILGGEVGCSRPIAADYRWLGEDRWIGISGKKLRGKLYIAVGISGAPQHIMAANDVKVIVAINKDKNAPIFEYADYGVVGDLYQVIPKLIDRLKKGV